MRPTVWSLQTGWYCTSCTAASDSWPTAASWAPPMREGWRTLHGSDAPCTELGWVCCNPHSAKIDQQREENETHNITGIKIVMNEDKNEHLSCTCLLTHLLKTVVLFTVGTVPAVPVPIGHHCILVTKPAVHICMSGLLSVGKKKTKEGWSNHDIVKLNESWLTYIEMWLWLFRSPYLKMYWCTNLACLKWSDTPF